MPSGPALLGLAILAALVLAALFADQIAPDPDAQELFDRLDAPSWAGGEHGHLLGTDGLGRDLLARVIHGARVSLTVGLVGVALSGGVGITLGLIAGYLGRRWDRIIMRVEAAAVHEDLFQQHCDKYRPHIRSFIESGMIIPSVQYVRAQRLPLDLLDVERVVLIGS